MPRASISSTKMMQGALTRARANRSRTRAAPTPTIASTNSLQGGAGRAGQGSGRQSREGRAGKAEQGRQGRAGQGGDSMPRSRPDTASHCGSAAYCLTNQPMPINQYKPLDAGLETHPHTNPPTHPPAGHLVEGHPRLPGNGLCDEGLAHPRVALQQDPLGGLGLQAGILLGVLQELLNSRQGRAGAGGRQARVVGQFDALLVSGGAVALPPPPCALIAACRACCASHTCHAALEVEQQPCSPPPLASSR